MNDVAEEIPEREDLKQLLSDLEPDLAAEGSLFEAGLSLLADGFASTAAPPWLLDGMLDRVAFKAHLGVAAGLFRVVEDDA